MQGIAFLISLLLSMLLGACGGGGGESPGKNCSPIEGVPPVRATPTARPPESFIFDLAPLSSLSPPSMEGSHIVDSAAAIRLGKALFWDRQAGSDGQTACASCHFNAGADSRRFNTVSPGPNALFEAGVSGPMQVWDGRNITTDDVVGSQGIASSIFVSLNPDPASAADLCQEQSDPFFGRERQVGVRNAPSVIGAAFHRESFWDGRASGEFNGFDLFGSYAIQFEGEGCDRRQVPVTSVVKGAPLASQAMGPPGNPLEMICKGRPIQGAQSLGAKLVERVPLGLQDVSPTDSVLGQLSASPAQGLLCGECPCTYRQLIAEAFGEELAAAAIDRFALIWGESLSAYQATLIPDETPFDRFLEGDKGALTPLQQAGLEFFQTRGNCVQCHSGAALSDASTDFAQKNGLVNRDGGDQGFHNIGVRPTEEDLGRAALGENGLSFSVTGSAKDRGAFKTPGLRNVGLTAPYFHNGGKATLVDVVGFYIQGGDFKNPELGRGIEPLNASTSEHDGLVELLSTGMTDCRVAMHRAPFDHPSLVVPFGPSLPAVGEEGLGPCP